MSTEHTDGGQRRNRASNRVIALLEFNKVKEKIIRVKPSCAHLPQKKLESFCTQPEMKLMGTNTTSRY